MYKLYKVLTKQPQLSQVLSEASLVKRNNKSLQLLATLFKQKSPSFIERWAFYLCQK